MIRPEHLLAVRQLNHVERNPAGVARCKRQMSRGVPVLGQGHVRKASRERVDDRHDGIAIGNGQSPTGEKVVLHVGDEQDVVVAELQ